MAHSDEQARIKVKRVQTGVRIEQRMLKVLKGLAELYDLSLGDLLEGIVLHAFEGESPFDEKSQKQIRPRKHAARCPPADRPTKGHTTLPGP